MKRDTYKKAFRSKHQSTAVPAQGFGPIFSCRTQLENQILLLLILWKIIIGIMIPLCLKVGNVQSNPI